MISSTAVQRMEDVMVTVRAFLMSRGGLMQYVLD